MSVSISPPVLMPLWMIIVAVVLALLVVAWLVRAFLVTRRDTSLEAGGVPMAPEARERWVARVEEAAKRFAEGDADLRGLHLELAAALRGFASARSGEDIDSATVREILDMADTAGPRSVEARLRAVLRLGRPLDSNPLGHVGELLGVWEEPSFGRESQADARKAADEALDQAREVVTRW